MANNDFDLPRPTVPVPSSSSIVANDNSKVWDYFINGEGRVETRTGKSLITLTDAIKKFGFGVADFTFDTGGTLDNLNLLIPNTPVDNFFYKYIGAGNPPLVVTPSFNPVLSTDWERAFTADANFLTNSRVTVDGIKSLVAPSIAGQSFSVTGFYLGSTIGGGDFIYDASRDKADHNGGTVIAPEAIAAWDGSFTNLPSLLGWSGSGSGCFVRPNSVPFLRLQLYPEMFGAPESNATFIDETFIHQKMWDLATSLGKDGAEIQLFRIYPVNGLKTDGVGRRGVRIFAASGVDFKRGIFSKGYCPVQDNQECILKFGGDEQDGDSEASYLEGVTLFGRDFNFTKGMVWASRLSQGSWRFCSFRRARAPAIYLQKLEDWDFYNCNFGLLGGNDGRGAVVFAEPPILGGVLADVGNNAIRFNQGRFEFIDGPMVSTAGVNAWASTVTFLGTKFEPGAITTIGDPWGDGVAYGSFSANYPIFNILEGIAGRITIRLVAGCSFSGVSSDRCLALFKVFKADEFSCTGALLSGSNTKITNLFDLSGSLGEKAEILNFKFTDNTARVYGDESDTALDYNFVNKNKWSVDFDYPLSGNTGNNKAYKTAGKNYWFMSEHGVTSTRFDLVENPDNATDPCLSPARTVMTNNFESSQVLFYLNRVGLDSQLKGWLPSSSVINVAIRAKLVGASQFAGGYRVFLRDDVGSLGRVDINSSTLKWHKVFITIPEGRGTNLRFVTEADLATAKVYVDAVEIQPVTGRYVDYTGVASIPSIAAGEVYSLAISQAGINADDFYLFAFNNASLTPNARITSYIPFSGGLRVQIENLNASTAISAFTMNWKIRVIP